MMLPNSFIDYVTEIVNAVYRKYIKYPKLFKRTPESEEAYENAIECHI